MSKCIFCEIPNERIHLENALAIAIMDNYPVTPSHSLIIPKRHIDNYFLLTEPESLACFELLNDAKDFILRTDNTVEGFNIGMNCGEVAGQTIFHCHIHLIPRRVGDVDSPRGGVRHLIPGMGDY